MEKFQILRDFEAASCGRRPTLGSCEVVWTREYNRLANLSRKTSSGC